MNPADWAAHIDQGAADLRAFAEARMRSRVIVRRKTGRKPPNEETGREEPEWLVVHESLPFRLAGSSSGAGGSHTVTLGDVEYEQATAVGHFPAATADLQDNDYIEVITGEWPGAVFSIVKAIRADQKTARRLPITEQARPTEWGA